MALIYFWGHKLPKWSSLWGHKLPKRPTESLWYFGEEGIPIVPPSNQSHAPCYGQKLFGRTGQANNFKFVMEIQYPDYSSSLSCLVSHFIWVNEGTEILDWNTGIFFEVLKEHLFLKIYQRILKKYIVKEIHEKNCSQINIRKE